MGFARASSPMHKMTSADRRRARRFLASSGHAMACTQAIAAAKAAGHIPETLSKFETRKRHHLRPEVARRFRAAHAPLVWSKR